MEVTWSLRVKNLFTLLVCKSIFFMTHYQQHIGYVLHFFADNVTKNEYIFKKNKYYFSQHQTLMFKIRIFMTVLFFLFCEWAFWLPL